jgi:hypothetical protein
MFESKVLRRIFGPRRVEIIGWRKMHDEELHKSRSMGGAGHVARMGEKRAYGVLEVKPEGKRPLGRPRHRWEEYIIKWMLEK